MLQEKIQLLMFGFELQILFREKSFGQKCATGGSGTRTVGVAKGGIFTVFLYQFDRTTCLF